MRATRRSLVKRLNAALAAAAAMAWPLLGGAAPLAPAKLRSRMIRMSPWFVTYSRHVSPPHGLSVLAVAGEGCMLQVSAPPFGIELPARPELGTYHWRCPAEEAEELRTLVGPAMADARAAKGQTVARGTRFLTFGLGAGSDAVEAFSVPLDRPLTPAIQAFDAAVARVARAAQDHPYLVVRASGRTETPTLAPGGELSFTVALANAGVVPLTIHNPAVAAPAPVTIMLSDKDGESQLLEPGKGEIVASIQTPAAPGPTTAPLVTLAPGEAVSLAVRMRRHAYLSAGTYRVVARYRSEKTGIPETQHVEGFLNLELGTLTVRREAPAPRRKERP